MMKVTSGRILPETRAQESLFFLSPERKNEINGGGRGGIMLGLKTEWRRRYEAMLRVG